MGIQTTFGGNTPLITWVNIRQRALKKPNNENRDPNIIHLNIAFQMVVSLYFGGESHVSNGQTVSFKEPWGMIDNIVLMINLDNRDTYCGWTKTISHHRSETLE